MAQQGLHKNEKRELNDLCVHKQKTIKLHVEGWGCVCVGGQAMVNGNTKKGQTMPNHVT